MAITPKITIELRDLPEVKARIKELEDALRQVKELAQKGYYYRIGSFIDKVLDPNQQ